MVLLVLPSSCITSRELCGCGGNNRSLPHTSSQRVNSSSLFPLLDFMKPADALLLLSRSVLCKLGERNETANEW